MPDRLKSVDMHRMLRMGLISLLGLWIVTLGLMASVPPVSRDALIHHLAIPKLYIQNGGIFEIPSMVYTYYPQNLDLLYLIPLLFKIDSIPKYIHLLFGLLTATLIYNYIKSRLNRVYALWGALSFLSLPIVIKLSITVYVDLGLMFFTMAALVYIFKYAENEFLWRYLVLAAVFCGLGLGTKYNGLIVCVLLTGLVALWHYRLDPNPEGKRVRTLGVTLLFLTIALVVFSPWMIRNYWWTNNPIYPLYNQLFNPDAPSITRPLGHFSIRRMIYGETWWQIALIPIRVFFHGQDSSPQYFDGQLNPFLLIFAGMACLRTGPDSARPRFELWVMGAFAVVYILYAFFAVDMRIRYIGPTIPFLVILSVFGLHNLYAVGKQIQSLRLRLVFTCLIHASLVIMIGLNASYLIRQFQYVSPLPYISGQITRDAYIEKYRPEYATMQYINANLQEDAVLLSIFLGGRHYYCDRKMIFDNDAFRNLVKSTDAPAGIFAELDKQDITHLFIGMPLLKKWLVNDFSTDDKTKLRAFFKQFTKLQYSKNGYSLLKLTS